MERALDFLAGEFKDRITRRDRLATVPAVAGHVSTDPCSHMLIRLAVERRLTLKLFPGRAENARAWKHIYYLVSEL